MLTGSWSRMMNWRRRTTIFERIRRITCIRRQILQLTARASEVESLQKDKEIVLVTLHKAEEEVVVLFEENRFLNEENKTLLLLLESKRLLRSSDSKNSSSASVKGKRKASLRDNSPTGGATDFSYASSSRESLCHRNLQCCTSETDLNLKESCYGSTGVVVPSGNV
ncbi:uncharacterized protein LOC109728952 isoform X2 [Ananas comosus]|uniref:Uncharacterized protein LOC109728952 isoform X2 n=1 Tax=Ananas comosus TaxID=4615 RepID=A0A6P5HMD5_ANACO|nr:uncharacterized protein LOC109728952 isoform X2 [Ananas comosus]XP_020115106.1 uncharacterized protein LOC109728952 isoform X2 [Ananas comosus]